MSYQYHYVVFYDESKEQWFVDVSTTDTAFEHGAIYSDGEQQWKRIDNETSEAYEKHYEKLLTALQGREYI